jgi:hypothetical protein
VTANGIDVEAQLGGQFGDQHRLGLVVQETKQVAPVGIGQRPVPKITLIPCSLGHDLTIHGIHRYNRVMGNNSHQVEPSRWVERWARCFPSEAAILDVAGGAGRHTLFLLGRGHHVTVIDRDCSALDDLNQHPRATVLKADLEAGVPFLGSHFGVVLVTNFLLRSMFPHLIDAVGPGGYLIYETFTSHHARYRRPQDSRHLAAPGELRNLVTEELDVLAYEEVAEQGSRRTAVARLAATRP